MEFQEVDRIVGHLIAIRGGQGGPFELDDRQNSLPEKDAVNPHSPAPKVVFQDHMLVVGEIGFGQRLPEQFHHLRRFVQVLPKESNAGLPFLFLL
jgi:hypothetical protein